MKKKKEAEVSSPKSEVLKQALERIQKKYGKGAVQILSRAERADVDVWPTGLMSVDWVCGVGGLPKGRIVELFGPESSGKTTLALHTVAEAQRKDPELICAFIDAEHAFGIEYAKSLGIDMDRLLFHQPDYGEQALEIAEELTATGAVGLIVIDSVAALVPKAELEGNVEDQQIGLQARLMSKALRRLTALLAKTDTCCVFVNQLRSEIGGRGGGGETTPGGRALKFYASLRLELRPFSRIKEDNRVVATEVRVTAVKNKVATPYRSRPIRLRHGKGFDSRRDVVQIAFDYGLISKNSTWYDFEGFRCQGLDKFAETIPDDKFEALKEKALAALKGA